MKQAATSSLFLAFLLAFTFIACNNEEKKEEPAKTDATKTEMPATPAYDAAMDPMKVEGPYITHVFGDTLNMKFYEVDIKPGDSVNMHIHPDHLVYVLEGANAELKNKEGKASLVEFKTGMGMVLGPDTHSGKNIGTTTLRLLVADIYRPRS